MGFDPLSLAALGIAAASTGVSVGGAIGQNRNVKQAQEAQAAAARVQQQQLTNQAQVETVKRQSEAHLLESRLRVLAGESGLSFGGSLNDLSRQVEYDRSFNDEIAKRNLDMNLMALATGTAAQQTQLESQKQSPIFAGILGGLQGLSAGLSIASGINSLGNLSTTKGPK